MSAGTITNCYNLASVTGTSYVGGIAGYVSSSSSSSFKGITGCYNTGSVTGTGSYVAGIIGYVKYVSISNNYWGGNCATEYGIGYKNINTGAENSATLLSDAKSANWSLYSSWDFDEIWEISSGTNNGYPVLKEKDCKEFWTEHAAASYGGGSGTSSSPYLISNGAQLALMAKNCTNGAELTGYFKLTANIDLSLYNWVSIGGNKPSLYSDYSPGKFCGVFDGNGYVISNMIIESFPPEWYLGLFGYASNCTLKNIGLKNTSIKADYGVLVGAVAGYVGTSANNTTLIENCWNSGILVAEQQSGGLFGEVAAMNYSSGSASATVRNCYNFGEVAGWNTIAGLIGTTGSTVTVEKCFNFANVKEVDISSGSGKGGIVGSCGGSIDQCFNSGDIEGTGGDIGGITGGRGIVSNCYNTGNISGGGKNVGGIVGGITGSRKIINCYNTGSVYGTSGYIGGITGYVYNSSNVITYCYNTGSVTGSGSYIGGVIGYIGRASSQTVTSNYWGGNCATTYGIASSSSNDNASNLSTITTNAKSSSWSLYSSYWDFSSIWRILSSQNDGYPVFKWQLFVTLNANGGTIDEGTDWTGSGSTATKTVISGTRYGVLPVLTRENYTFNGWYTSTSYTTKVTENSTLASTSDHTLYAKWTLNSITVTLNANGGTIPSGSSWTGSGSTATKTVLPSSTYGTLPTPTLSGYTFAGWAGNMIVSHAATVTNSTSYCFFNSTLTEDLQSNTTYAFVTQIKLSQVPTSGDNWVGIWLDGGYVNVAMKYDVGTSWVTWRGTFTTGDVSTYSHGGKKVIHVYNGPSSQSASKPISMNYFALYKLSDATNIAASPSTSSAIVTSSSTVTPTSDHTLYAIWTYTITYKANNGSGTVPSSVTKTKGASATLATNSLTRTGFTANGWNTSTTISSSPTYASGASYSGGNVTLYANWSPKAKSVTLAFKFNESGSWDTTARSGFSYKASYVTTTLSGTGTTSTSATISSASTKTMRAGQTITLNTITCPEGWVCVGYTSGTTTPSETSSSAVSTVSPYLADNTTAITYYICFKYVGLELKYDSQFKYFYFEDGEMPQTAVSTYSSSFNTLLTNVYSSSTGSSFTSNDITFMIQTYTYASGQDSTFSSYSGQKFMGFVMPKTRTIKLQNPTASSLTYSSYTFTAGTTYWFRFDPIRWRVSDYGVASTNPPSAWNLIGETTSNVKVASDILWWDVMNDDSSNKLGAGDTAMQTTFSQALSNGTLFGGLDLEFLGESTFKIDEFNTPTSNEKVLTTTTGAVDMRYIRFSSNGSSKNASNHLTLVKIKTSNGSESTILDAPNNLKPTVYSGTMTLASDATGTTAYYNISKTCAIDLGSVKNVSSILMRRYFADSRIYYGNKIEYSVDGTNWYTYWDSYNTGAYGSADSKNAYSEASAGRWFTLGAIRVASVDEIETYQNESNSYASALACVLAGKNQDKFVEYWTRDLGQQIGCGTYVTKSGTVMKNSYWNIQKGVRLSMCLSQCGNAGL